MAKIEGLERVVSSLRARAARAKRDGQASVIVGYTAAYAVYVHENLEAHHPVGEAKFLERPAREGAKELGRIARIAYSKGQTVAQSLVLAGLQLQRWSQLRVPVDTGNLKNSAFTRLE